VNGDELARALRWFGARGYAVMVNPVEDDWTRAEVKVEVWKYAPQRDGTTVLVFKYAKSQDDGDVVAALRFIVHRFLGIDAWERS